MDQYQNELLYLITKILALSVITNIENQKTKILTNDKMIAAYGACNGINSIAEIANAADYGNSRPLESHLPKWENLGILISVSFGANKRYLALENISSYFVHLQSKEGN